MMLRRLKEDVEKNLAPKQETIIEVCVNDAHLLADLMDKKTLNPLNIWLCLPSGWADGCPEEVLPGNSGEKF